MIEEEEAQKLVNLGNEIIDKQKEYIDFLKKENESLRDKLEQKEAFIIKMSEKVNRLSEVVG